MILREENRDLLDVTSDYYLAHCISADFAFGAGIALEIEYKYGIKKRLIDSYTDYFRAWKNGTCILSDRIMNLVTKKYCYDIPTYLDLELALKEMKILIKSNNIYKIAMPKIGCGIDKLEWQKVKYIIYKIFYRMKYLEILVCYL